MKETTYYFSLTDMARYRNADNAGFVIQNWMRNRNVIRFLGLWERLNNPDFNYLEFEAIEKEAGVNSFVLTPKRWTESTNAMEGQVTRTGDRSLSRIIINRSSLIHNRKQCHDRDAYNQARESIMS